MSDVIELSCQTYGAGVPTLVLHGFTGSHAAMGGLMAGLSGRRLIAPDLIGHGKSPAPGAIEPYRVSAQIAQLDALLDRLGHPVVDLIGYSMGARLALSYAVTRQARVRRLILLSGRAGIDDPQARAARMEADEALADRIEAEGVPAFARRWAALPIFATQSPAVRAAQHAIRIKQRATGLANSLRGFGAGAMPPVHACLSALNTPTCLIAGALDEKFTRLAHAMAGRLPMAEVHGLARVGHAVHLEAPARVAAIVNAWLG